MDIHRQQKTPSVFRGLESIYLTLDASIVLYRPNLIRLNFVYDQKRLPIQMIDYNHGIPMYWRDEASGKMLEAIIAFWSPYADSPRNIPPISDEHISLLRWYLIHWAKAPCWRMNPHISTEQLMQLDNAIALAENINSGKDICKTLDALMVLAIDPF